VPRGGREIGRGQRRLRQPRSTWPRRAARWA
jgi:hypothetical protein